MRQTLLFHFSPTGTSERIGRAAACAAGWDADAFDLTDPWLQEIQVPEKTLSVFAAPVYGGRIPPMAAQAIQKIRSAGTDAIVIAVYGGRAYEDALIELADCVKASGFRVVAAAACLARHALVPDICAGRPTVDDLKQTSDFSLEVMRRLDQGPLGEPQIPGRRPYEAQMPKLGVSPAADRALCTKCGLCATKCPTEAIDFQDPAKAADTDKCIACTRCIWVCPQGARSFPAPFNEAIANRLSQCTDSTLANEYFLAD